MKSRRAKTIPVLIAASVVGLVCLLQGLPRLLRVPDKPAESHFELFERIEWMTYDWRMRLASRTAGPAATNLVAVFVDDANLASINAAYGYYWPWPRQLFGRLIRELKAQGAHAIASDIFFLERHADFAETRAVLPSGETVSSDAFFGQQLRVADNVILGCPGEIVGGRWQAVAPPDLFRTNAVALGYASTDRDPDGVLRRAAPFRDDPVHGRIWHLGIRLAALAMGLDLDRATVAKERLVLPGPGGVTRVIPLDPGGYLLIDWTLGVFDPRIFKPALEEILELDNARQQGEAIESVLAGSLVFLGSIGSGSNISDVGATPLAKETYLVSKHWNVANAILLNRFVRPPVWWAECLAIVLLGAASARVTWRLRASWASLAVVGLAMGYTLGCVGLFLGYRYWLPLTWPVLGGLLLMHLAMITYRVVFEQAEQRRVRSIFSRIVSPDVVNELLGKETLALGGALRPVTVLFADVRGFTQMTDDNQKRAEAYVQRHGLSGAAAEAVLEQNARETLATVNLYLATIADRVKQHGGTLDKYIGDCVMAFWGAPVANERHAVACVRAALDAQRALHQLNQERTQENRRRAAAEPAGGDERPPLPVLSLGTGINTGTVTVGLMGSDTHILNYTVFGREVNLASRLESFSGRGRVIVSEATFRELDRWDPGLASTCVALPPTTLRGISQPVQIYEVPWQTPASTVADP
ncbi:MAG: adenylate/guanylate cyclase domain-containing protein [Verrucomicrobia bacterium]|nr:adenylate/guanylate cyclase domain-containing protein [Verrucomicrobiota bacterium]